jgi:hypothetical protein
MTLAQFVNAAALVVTCAVVFGRGRRPERLGMTLLAMAFLVTPLVEARGSWYEPQYGILTVDVLTLVALIAIAVRYDRYWPICAAAFQAVAVLTHVAFLIEPVALYRAFFFGNFSIGFLLLGSILGGTLIEVAPVPFHFRLSSRSSPFSEP